MKLYQNDKERNLVIGAAIAITGFLIGGYGNELCFLFQYILPGLEAGCRSTIKYAGILIFIFGALFLFISKLLYFKPAQW